jgi:hypothetical protein
MNSNNKFAFINDNSIANKPVLVDFEIKANIMDDSKTAASLIFTLHNPILSTDGMLVCKKCGNKTQKIAPSPPHGNVTVECAVCKVPMEWDLQEKYDVEQKLHEKIAILNEIFKVQSLGSPKYNRRQIFEAFDVLTDHQKAIILDYSIPHLFQTNGELIDLVNSSLNDNTQLRNRISILEQNQVSVSHIIEGMESKAQKAIDNKLKEIATLSREQVEDTVAYDFLKLDTRIQNMIDVKTQSGSIMSSNVTLENLRIAVKRIVSIMDYSNSIDFQIMKLKINAGMTTNGMYDYDLANKIPSAYQLSDLFNDLLL